MANIIMYNREVTIICDSVSAYVVLLIFIELHKLSLITYRPIHRLQTFYLRKFKSA
jgi:hypothetical protein